MIVGLLEGELHFPENHSLKDKRMVLRKILARLRAQLNVSAAEVDFQDLWQRSQIAVVCVNTSQAEATDTLQRALRMIDEFNEVEFLHSHFETR